MTTELDKVALYLSPTDRHAAYYRETLEHAGLVHELVDDTLFSRMEDFGAILLCGYGRLDASMIARFEGYVSSGGLVICSGSTWGLDELLGVASDNERRPNDALIESAQDAGELWPTGAASIRFFGGVYAQARNCMTSAHIEGGVGVSKSGFGKGFAWLVAPHVGQTVSTMQLGVSVETHAVGPNDGSAGNEPGPPCAEDGTALRFDRDRRSVANGAAPFFADPHADALKELFVRVTLHALRQTGRTATVLWHWPSNSSAVAVLSIDCEEFNPHNVAAIYKMLMMFGATAAWLVAVPGYPLDVYRAIKRWDHEVGLIFVTDGEAGWNEEKLKIQHISLCRGIGVPTLSSLRPLKSRWKQRVQFYEMAETAGCRISLSKGGRQPGSSGFPFGTCHPFAPLRATGIPFKLYELPYSVYMAGVCTQDTAVPELIKQCELRYGCFHLSVASDCVQDSAACDSLKRAVSLVKQQGFEFLLPEDVAKFERARRGLKVRTALRGSVIVHTVNSETEAKGVTMLQLGAEQEAVVAGQSGAAFHVRRYGLEFSALNFDLAHKSSVEIAFKVGSPRSAAA